MFLLKTSLIIGCITFLIGCNPPKDTNKTLAHYNILWDTQSKNASESMPLLGGDIGCNVWVEEGQIMMYLQRSGSFSENGEYLKMGRFRISLDPDPFEDASFFRQELKLADGYIEIESRGGKGPDAFIKLWVDVNKPVVNVDIEASSPIEVTVAYESWRTEDKELLDVRHGRRERFTAFSLEGYPGDVIRIKDQINFSDDGILFYHRNPSEKLIPEVMIRQQGLEDYTDQIYDNIENRTFGGLLFGKGFVPGGNEEGVYQITPFKSWVLKSERHKKKHQLHIVTHIEQAETVDAWTEKLREMARNVTLNPQDDFSNTVSWWHAFWDRSHIFINPANTDPSDPVWQMGRNYQLFRYQLGGNVHGEYPTKFNGGNLIYDPVLVNENTDYEPDWRQWGGDVFTAQNQRLVYWPMLKSGDFDAVLPQFELYRKGLPAAQARVKVHFGHEGAIFTEYMNSPGLVFGAGWGWPGEGHRARGSEIPFGDPLATGARGYNDLVEKGIQANQSCAYHWESQLEHAYMIMEYHRFSGADISQYIPFIKASVIFFDEHYQLRETIRSGKPLDDHGRLIIYPSTACETYRGATNPTDLIAGLNACIQSILLLDEKYFSALEKEYFSGYLNRIPEYPFEEEDGVMIMKPAWSWLRVANMELPQMYPLFPFDQFKLGDDEIEVFKNTYRLAGDFQKGKIQSWHQDGIFLARMGMTEEAADYNTRKLQDSQRRFPTFWGPGYDWVPDHNHGGSGMIGLQEMLMQTVGDQIVLFPAWPRDWDVNFKLHAPHNTIVECSLKDGKIVKLKVHPETRSKDVQTDFK